jgi:hypothetical protein
MTTEVRRGGYRFALLWKAVAKSQDATGEVGMPTAMLLGGPVDRLGEVLYSPTNNNQITFDSVQDGDPRQLTPAREAESLKQSKAWFIVTKNKAK